MGDAGIRRSGISALAPSSSAARRPDRQLNNGVHQTGASPILPCSFVTRASRRFARLRSRSIRLTLVFGFLVALALRVRQRATDLREVWSFSSASMSRAPEVASSLAGVGMRDYTAVAALRLTQATVLTCMH